MIGRKMFGFAIAAMIGLSMSLAPIEQVQAQARATVYKPKKVPQKAPGDLALLWFRFAKHSDHRWGVDVDIGLGALIGNVGRKRTSEKIPLKKPLWPTVQIAAYDAEKNEFLGEGESDKSLRRTQTRSFYIPFKRFVFEDENYRHYVVSVSSGNYVIGGTQSTCFCWGSKWFKVRKGEVLNMGTYYVATENGLSFWPELATLNSADDLEEQGYITDTMKLGAPSADDKVPAILSHLQFLPVEYRDAALFGNHYGRLANKMIADDWEAGTPLILPPTPIADGEGEVEAGGE